MAELNAEPIDVTEAFLVAFAAMDVDTALTFLAEDVEYTNIPLGTVRGHAGVREVLEPFFAPVHENEFLIKVAVWRDYFDLATAAKIHDPSAT